MNLYHYFDDRSGPFHSLSEISIEEAKILLEHMKIARPDSQCAARHAQYVEYRQNCEEILRREFKKKGGVLQRKNPHYMVVEHSPWLSTWFEQSAMVAIPIEEFDLRTLSFTYGDSMPTFSPTINDGREYRHQIYTYEEILGQLREVTGIESGLFFYPHLRGAGAPYWNPKITGSFLGIRDIHTSRHMLRAVLEGLSMQAKMIVDMEEKLAGKKVDALCVVGGGSHNILWQTIKASVLQKPVELCYEAEATALGAAMLAAVGDGVYGDISQASGKLAAGNRLVEPDEGLVKRYRGLYELYREGYEQMETFSERIYDEVRR